MEFKSLSGTVYDQLSPWGKINIEEATSIYVITISLMFLSGILKSDRAGKFFLLGQYKYCEITLFI